MKRGASQTTMVFLLVLLVLGVALILFAFLEPRVENTGVNTREVCITLNLEPESCEYNPVNGKTAVVLKRKPGRAELFGETLIFKINGKDTFRNFNEAIGELESRTIIIHPELAEAPESVKVSGIINASGGEIICSETSRKITCEPVIT